MILSVSRRTDIPDHYSKWFINRIQEGFLYVRNPFNAHQISRIPLSPDVVDCIVFWSKNPINMMGHLESLADYRYYFQFTLTGYGKDIEPGLPDKRRELIPAFQGLSEKIGKERVIWRYDPIFLNEKYTIEYHLKAFEEIACSLSRYTCKTVISFLDLYAKIQRRANGIYFQEMTDAQMLFLAEKLAQIARKYHLAIETCAEQIELQHIGVRHGSCIDKNLIERLSGCRLTGSKDKNQRKECGCLESIEVGAYNTCLSGCRYCYANAAEKRIRETVQLYNADAPLLCGTINPGDKITDRNVKSLKDAQVSISDWYIHERKTR